MTTQSISIPQHTASVDALIAEVTGLNSFEEVQGWDNKAKAALDKITADLDAVEKEIASVQQELTRLQAVHDAKPAYLKLMGKGGEYKSAEKQLAQFQTGQAQLEELADMLQGTIDMTPNSPDEQKLLIKGLRLQKKELQAQKKEVAAEMRAIRVESRQKSAQVTNYGFRSLSGLATAERRRLRLQREIGLAPQEDRKAAIEKQILKLERLILWAEKLK